MLRRPGFLLTSSIKGRPWKKRDPVYAIHPAQRPAQPVNVDYKALNLTFEPDQVKAFDIPRLGWSKPPTTKPKLPFQV